MYLFFRLWCEVSPNLVKPDRVVSLQYERKSSSRYLGLFLGSIINQNLLAIFFLLFD